MMYSWEGTTLRVTPSDEHEASVLISMVATLESYGFRPAPGEEMQPREIVVSEAPIEATDRQIQTTLSAP